MLGDDVYLNDNLDGSIGNFDKNKIKVKFIIGTQSIKRYSLLNELWVLMKMENILLQIFCLETDLNLRFLLKKNEELVVKIF